MPDRGKMAGIARRNVAGAITGAAGDTKLSVGVSVPLIATNALTILAGRRS